MRLTEEQRKEIANHLLGAITDMREEGYPQTRRLAQGVKDLLADLADAEREREEIRTLGASGLQDALDEMIALRTRVRELEEENAWLRSAIKKAAETDFVAISAERKSPHSLEEAQGLRAEYARLPSHEPIEP